MADRDPTNALLGKARCPGDSWADLMAADSKPVPDILKNEHYEYLGSDPINTERYTSAEFAERERTRMWPYVWQFVARDEDLPDPGDYIIHDNAGRSFLIVRQADGSVRAFYNVCLHRGRKLRTEDGWAADFVCPFHGFAWNTDGSLKNIPCRWDFGHLADEKMVLPEASVATWAGYIFIREVNEGPTLEEYLAPMPAHFARWRHEELTTIAWVAKAVPANWKATMEAFMESYHAYVTHPQLMPFHGDANASYNNWGDHVNASWSLFGVISPHLDPTGKSQQWIVDEFERYNGRTADNFDTGTSVHVVVPDGVTARKAVGDLARVNYTKQFGYDHSQASDCELMDALVYNAFPNFSTWGGFVPSILYHWKTGANPDECIMEVRVLQRVPQGEPRPRAVPRKFLTADQKWTEAPELGVLGDVFEQDMSNLPFVQQGLHASLNKEINLADYQEIRVRHFQQTLDKYLAR